MSSRRSSGSIRAESEVEPTRSENITVTCRRSAESWVFGCASTAAASLVTGAAPVSSLMTAQHADVFEILIGQITQYRDIDAVFSKALRILRQAELFEPVRDLLHRAPFQRIHRT